MKRLILLLITWMSVCALRAQTDTENYILSRRMLRADSTAYIDHIAYHDGLGRPCKECLAAHPGNGRLRDGGGLEEYSQGKHGLQRHPSV